MIRELDTTALKLSFTTHAVPLEAMAGLVPLRQRPVLGQLVVAEVLKVGKNTTLENRGGLTASIFPGDRIVGAFGNRYATAQFEGYVPSRKSKKCDLLSVGGVCGNVASQHAAVRSPTRLRILGLVCDPDGLPLNLRSFGRPVVPHVGTAQVILVVGASMNSGKTTLAGTLARALVRAGFRVAAGKLTGTAAARDGRFYQSCGADPVLDFTDVGYPSTYMLDLEQLLLAHAALLSNLQLTPPDYVVIELADGIFQRETRMLLADETFRATIDHVFFAANDSLSAESGVRHLRAGGLPLRATSGLLTQSPLGIREAEEATGVPCLSPARMMDGAVLKLVDARRPDRDAVAVHTAARNGAAGNGHLTAAETVLEVG